MKNEEGAAYGSAEYVDSTGGGTLSANTGVTFTAKTTGAVTTGRVSSVTATSAAVSAAVSNEL